MSARFAAPLKTGLLALALGLGSSLASALPHGAGMDASLGAGHHRAEYMLDLVDATEAQRTQIKQIMRSAAEDTKPQRNALHQLHQLSRQLLAAPSIDAAGIESLRQQAQPLREQISARMSQALVAAAHVLTPEQRAKLSDRMAKREARRSERLQQRHQDKPGEPQQP